MERKWKFSLHLSESVNEIYKHVQCQQIWVVYVWQSLSKFCFKCCCNRKDWFSIFTVRAYARAVLGVIILSIRPSVRLSHACIVTKLSDTVQIFLYHTKGQSLCYSDTNSGWSATPPSLWNLCSKWPTSLWKRRLLPISAHSVSTIGDSKESSFMTNIKSTTGFLTSHRRSAYVTPKCPFFAFWV